MYGIVSFEAIKTIARADAKHGKMIAYVIQTKKGRYYATHMLETIESTDHVVAYYMPSGEYIDMASEPIE